MQSYFLNKYLEAKHRIIIDTLEVRQLNEKLQTYRKLKSQKKLHNIIVHIFRSNQRIQRVKKMSDDILLKRDHAIK